MAEARLPTVVLRGGTVVGADRAERGDVLVEGGRIVAIGPGIEVPRGSSVLDAGGCLVGPGLVDLHAHLREPGHEEAETIETGSRAAALGGYSAVVAMANTDPPIDHAAAVRAVAELAKGALVEVAVAGAITKGRAGERLAPLAEMAALGVRIFSDDGRGVQHAGLMRRALEYARPLGVLLAQHCEDEDLVAGGVMHEGAWSSRLGLPGQPALAEESMLARDLDLVRLTGAPMHFLHLSTARSVELVRRARAEGLPVTAEATPHHLTLTDAEVAGFDPLYRVNPPLRPPADVAAVRAGLLDGTIDAVATDHAPHAPDSKELPFDQAPPGMIGLETALSVAYGALCLGPEEDVPGWLRAVAKPDAPSPRRSQAPPVPRLAGAVELFRLMSSRPAAISGLDARGGHGGPLAPGARGHLCVFDPGERWRVDPGAGASRSANTPFASRELVGRVRHVLVAGEPVVVGGEAQR